MVGRKSARKAGAAVRKLRDRREAGRLLAAELMAYAERPDVVVLGLPRGGVVVAYEVAKALQAPLDIFMVRKLGVPGHEELAMGGIASGGVRTINHDVVSMMGISPAQIEAAAQRQHVVLEQREATYRGAAPPLRLEGRTVIVVDDGLATGASMRTAVRALRQHNPKQLVVAVPVAPESTCRELAADADEVVCVFMPEPFYAIGAWYQDFTQTADGEVVDLLREASEPTPE